MDKALPCSKAVSSSFSSTLADGGKERGSISSSGKMRRESMDATINHVTREREREERVKIN